RASADRQRAGLRAQPSRPRGGPPCLRPPPTDSGRDRAAPARGAERKRVMPLSYYSRAATQEYWSEHWGGEAVDHLVRVASTSPLTTIIEEALPSSGRILEAGCGLGQYVILLRQRHRAVIGADWSPEALRRSRSAAPSTPLVVMDLTRLAVKSG